MRQAAVLTSGLSHVLVVVVFLVIGIVIFRMPQLILIIGLEFLRSFGVLVGLTLRCLILTRMFIVSIIVVIFGASRRVLGEDQSLKLV
jgi:hypothetical protein